MDSVSIHDESIRLGHSAAWELDWGRAAAYYKKALAEQPASVDAMNALGLTFLQLGKPEQALALYTRAASAAPQDTVSREKCAEIHESLGNKKEAFAARQAAADLYGRLRDGEKAIANWLHMARLAPGNLAVRVRLATAFERLARPNRAVREYLHVASILQRSGRIEQAVEAVQHSLSLVPGDPDASHALQTLRQGAALPPPAPPEPLTTPLLKNEVDSYLARETREPEAAVGCDPETEARQAALRAPAGMLFDEPDAAAFTGDTHVPSPPGAAGSGSRRLMLHHLTEAIDCESRSDPQRAVQVLGRAVGAGLDHPAAHYILGCLYTEAGDLARAKDQLLLAVDSPELGIGACVGLGKLARQAGDWHEAARCLLRALRFADASEAAPDRSPRLAEMYDAMQASLEQDEAPALQSVVENALALLGGPEWRVNVQRARHSASGGETDGPFTIGEVILTGGTQSVLQSIERIDVLAERRLYASAMEEAYLRLDRAPDYLALHLRMASLLIKDQRFDEAVLKMKLVARTYQVRGQARRAADVYAQVLPLSPVDLEARTQLIGLLTEQGRLDEAADQYLELHALHRQMAEVDRAREALEHALQLAQGGRLSRDRHLRILSSLADTAEDLLNWRSALEARTQIRQIDPSDEGAQRSCVELNLRLGREQQAARELDQLLDRMVARGGAAEALTVLEETAREHPGKPSLHARLAEAYRASGRTADAIAQYDALGEIQLDAGAVAEAVRTIQLIVSLNPPEVENYRELLSNLKAQP